MDYELSLKMLLEAETTSEMLANFRPFKIPTGKLINILINYCFIENMFWVCYIENFNLKNKEIKKKENIRKGIIIEARIAQDLEQKMYFEYWLCQN